MQVGPSLRKLGVALVRFACACVLLFFTIALAAALPTLVHSSLAETWTGGTLLISFAAAFVVLGLGRGGGVGVRLYVFGHELTHWLAARVFRRRTGAFHVGGNRGYVMVERPNVWITLAPYFVPLYTVVWIGLYGVVRLFQEGPPGVGMVRGLFAGIGVTYAFHVYWTAKALLRGQEDLRVHGVFFSLAFILFWNFGLMYGALMIAGRAYRSGWACLAARSEWLWKTSAAAAAALAHGLLG